MIARWRAERYGGERGFDEVRVDILCLCAIVEAVVLEERVRGERGREKVRGEETGGVW